MKKLLLSVLIFLSLLPLFSNGNKEENTLTIYAYDTFCGDWGSGNEVIPAFEKETGIKVNLVSCGASGEMINRIKMEGSSSPCDIVLGVTDDQAEDIYPYLESYNSPFIKDIDPRLLFDSKNRLLPFDWGAFTFVYDSKSNIKKPEHLYDLTKDEYKDKFILIDPRTSSVGLGLLMWTRNLYKEDFLSWWEKAEENALTVSSGWSSAYGLFTEGEAPMVLSYTTSPVYHVMNENSTRYKALIFPEGHEITIEGVGIRKGTKNRKNAEAFIDYLLSSGQESVAVLSSMYPSSSKTTLPEAYSYAPYPEKLLKTPEEDKSMLLKKWSEAF